MQSPGRKREVSSCIPCYTRKQKCNHRYPCNHCTRRRRPEECAYYPSQAKQAAVSPPLQTDDHQTQNSRNHHHQREHSTSHESAPSFTGLHKRGGSMYNQGASLAGSFGYFEDSESNTMALVRRLGLNEEQNQDGNIPSMPQDVVDSVQRDIERMFDRHIFDFLVQYFVAEINWIDQLIHPPSFLAQYQEWWAKGTLLSVVDVEFAVLLLRICSYASQFLPSPSHTIDTIRGMLLADIRNTCDDIGDNLAAVCTSLDTRGSLLRVQHLCFAGLSSRCEGRTNAFWEALNGAIRVAQRVGIHRDAVTLIPGGMHELEKEMRRRTLCNLYIWDSLLSRQLDRIPFLPCSMGTENLPRMHLAPDIGDVHAPEAFTERVLQVHLAGFWRSFGPSRGAEYDLTVAEERYERFCSEFLTTLPSAFALQPDQKWDERLPALPMQRQLLWMAIFDSVCWNFRQVLLLEPSYVLSLPPYKQVLLLSQKMALAMAALHVLQAVSALHAMLGASHTRYTGIIFHTFEAAVILVGLCLDPDFPGDAGDGPPRAITTDPLGIRTASLTQERCMQAVQDGLNRLRMLADVSNMAEAGARTLARLLGRPTRASAVSHALEGSNCVQSWSSDSDEVCWSSLEHLDPNQLGGMLPAAVSEDWYPNLDLFPIGFDLSSLPNVLV